MRRSNRTQLNAEDTFTCGTNLNIPNAGNGVSESVIRRLIENGFSDEEVCLRTFPTTRDPSVDSPRRRSFMEKIRRIRLEAEST